MRVCRLLPQGFIPVLVNAPLSLQDEQDKARQAVQQRGHCQMQLESEQRQLKDAKEMIERQQASWNKRGMCSEPSGLVQMPIGGLPLLLLKTSNNTQTLYNRRPRCERPRRRLARHRRSAGGREMRQSRRGGRNMPQKRQPGARGQPWRGSSGLASCCSMRRRIWQGWGRDGGGTAASPARGLAPLVVCRRHASCCALFFTPWLDLPAGKRDLGHTYWCN